MWNVKPNGRASLSVPSRFVCFAFVFSSRSVFFGARGSSYRGLFSCNMNTWYLPFECRSDTVSRERTLNRDANINVIKCCFTVLLIPLAQVGNLNPNPVSKWPTPPLTINNSYIKVITGCKCSEWLLQKNLLTVSRSRNQVCLNIVGSVTVYCSLLYWTCCPGAVVPCYCKEVAQWWGAS